MRVKLESVRNYSTISSESDVLGLLQAIKGVVHFIDEKDIFRMTRVNLEIALYGTRQGRSVTNAAYLEGFNARVESVETHGKVFGNAPITIKKETAAVGKTSNEIEDRKKKSDRGRKGKTSRDAVPG